MWAAIHPESLFFHTKAVLLNDVLTLSANRSSVNKHSYLRHPIKAKKIDNTCEVF